MIENTNRVLKLAKKKRGLTVRDVNFWILEDLVKRDLLNKTYPRRGRGAGWPFYKISRRGKGYLNRVRGKQQ